MAVVQATAAGAVVTATGVDCGCGLAATLPLEAGNTLVVLTVTCCVSCLAVVWIGSAVQCTSEDGLLLAVAVVVTANSVLAALVHWSVWGCCWLWGVAGACTGTPSNTRDLSWQNLFGFNSLLATSLNLNKKENIKFVFVNS